MNKKKIIILLVYILVFLQLLLNVSCDYFSDLHNIPKENGSISAIDETVGVLTDYTDIRLLMPVYSRNQVATEQIQTAVDELSQRTQQALKCRVLLDMVPEISYRNRLSEIIAAGLDYDIFYLESEGFKDSFLYQDQVDSGILADITELLPTYYPKGLYYANLIENAKTRKGRIYAIPQIFKVNQAYGLLCKNDLLEKLNVSELCSYQDTVDFLNSCLNTGKDLEMLFSFENLLDLYLADSQYIQIAPTIVLNPDTKEIRYIEDTEIFDTVYWQYKAYYDAGAFNHERKPIGAYDISLMPYNSFKLGASSFVDCALRQEDLSLLFIKGQNNQLYRYQPLGALGISSTSCNPDRALMLLSYLNAGDTDIIDLLMAGVENIHYERTPDQKLNMTAPGSPGFHFDPKNILLGWGTTLLNYDSVSSAPFLYEKNPEGWLDCYRTEYNEEIIPGFKGSDLLTLYSQAPEDIRLLWGKRRIPMDWIPSNWHKQLNEYFTGHGYYKLVDYLKSGQDDELMNWLYSYLNIYNSKNEQSAEIPQENDQKKTTLVMVGDVLLHDRVNASGKGSDGSYNYDHLFKNIKEDVESADLALINQEVILGGLELGLSGYPTFNGAYEVGHAIAKAGFDIVLHATNHALDKGLKGVQNCLNFWEQSYPEIGVIGINRSQEEQDNHITVYEKNGIKIAVLNYTYDTNGIAPPSNMPYLVNYLDRNTMKAHIKKADEIADFVIVCPHWGVEYQTKPSSDQKNLARFFADLGVDLVIGTHPHVIEPVEWVEGVQGNKTLVFYSLGNFINATSGTNEGVSARMVGAMAQVTIEKNSDGEIIISDYQALPLVTHIKSGSRAITTYLLSDYSSELATENEIILQDPDFSYEYCVNLWKEVMPQFVK